MAKTTELDLHTIIQRAGGTNHVAREFGLSSSAVSQWLRRGKLPDSEAARRTNYSTRLIEMSGLEIDEWSLRLLGIKD